MENLLKLEFFFIVEVVEIGSKFFLHFFPHFHGRFSVFPDKLNFKFQALQTKGANMSHNSFCINVLGHKKMFQFATNCAFKYIS